MNTLTLSHAAYLLLATITTCTISITIAAVPVEHSVENSKDDDSEATKVDAGNIGGDLPTELGTSQLELLPSVFSNAPGDETPAVVAKRNVFSCRDPWAPGCSAAGSSWATPSRSLRGFRISSGSVASGGGSSRSPGIPSIVSSGGWGAGTMGKRLSPDMQKRRDLLSILRERFGDYQGSRQGRTHQASLWAPGRPFLN